MDGYVLFADAATYEEAHVQGRTALGLPRVGFRAGRLAPDRQHTIDVAPFRTNQVDGGDSQVVVYVDNRFWPSDVITDFVFFKRDQVTDYFPPAVD